MAYKLIKVLVIITIFFSINSYLIAEINTTIHLTNGKSISGQIISEKGSDSVVVMLEGGYRQAYHKSEVESLESIRKRFAIGLGIGAHYGILGGCMEFEVIPHINLTAGLGSTIRAGMGWNVGSIIYFIDQDYFLRPRLSLLYGTNYILEGMNNYGYSNQDAELFEGLNLGAGLSIYINESHAFNFDVIYVATSSYYDKKRELEKAGYYVVDSEKSFALSIGYKFCF
jgi:hypothetical protein